MRNINEQMSLGAEATIQIYDKNVAISNTRLLQEYSFGDQLKFKQTVGNDYLTRTTIEKDLDLCGNKLGVKIGQFRHQKELLKQLVNSNATDIEGFQLSTDIMGMKFEFTHGKVDDKAGKIHVIDTEDKNSVSRAPTRSAYSLSGNFESCGRDLKWCIDYDDFSDEADIGLTAGLDEIDGEFTVLIPINGDRSGVYGLRSKMVEGYDIAMAYDDRKSAKDKRFNASVCTEVCGTDVEFRYQERPDAQEQEKYNIVLRW